MVSPHGGLGILTLPYHDLRPFFYLTSSHLAESKGLPCHGPTGKGEGPVGVTLNPRPTDLAIHVAPGVHPDSQLYDWITNGFPASAMSAFNEAHTDEERWHLVNYIRTFADE